jgi:urease accessory protein
MRRQSKSWLATLLVGFVLSAVSTALAPDALAHHAMGGRTVATFWQGLLSGLAHPVIGPDHLLFLIAVGIASAFVPSGGALPVAFIVASTAGVLAHVGNVTIPLADALVAASVILAGAVLLLGLARARALWIGLALAAGLLHGFAYGEAVVGAEPAPVVAYLIGLAIVGLVIMAVALVAARLLLDPATRGALPIRMIGAAFGLAGAALLAMAMQGA